MNFLPLQTIADLETLDEAEIIAGYREWREGDPEPGPNRGRAYWHGWRNAMIDRGKREPDEAARRLAHDAVVSGWLKRVTSR